jgi:hypothetical protein
MLMLVSVTVETGRVLVSVIVMAEPLIRLV